MNEVVLDTNIFLRYLLEDIELQHRETVMLFGQIEDGEFTGWVSVLVLAEIVWLLEKHFEFERREFVPRLVKLLRLKGMKGLEVKKEVLVQVLRRFSERKFDFTDVYLAVVAGDREIRSFDKDFGKIRKG